ncbi:hypothetical protein PG988_010328 [Apiospora saccharicola]
MVGLYASEPPAGQGDMKEIIVVSTIAMAVGVTALSLRLFTRVRILRKRIKTDDYFVMVAMFCAIIAFVLTLEQMKHGLSYHKWDVLWSEYASGYSLYAVIETCFYTLSVGAAKLSILCFYLQLSPVEWFRWSTIGLMGAVTVFSITYACVNLFPCRPVAASWNDNITGAVCLDTWGGYLALSILNILIDVATLAIPIPILLPLQITVRQKISLIALFGAGAIVCAITIARASIIPSLKASQDRPWDVTIDYLLAFLEMNIGIVCASVPALKPFFIRYLPSLVSSHLSKNRRQQSTSRDYHLNTVVETNRQRRRMQSRSYALGSRSTDGGGSVTMNSKKGTLFSSFGRSWAGTTVDNDEDETRLWSSSHMHHSKDEEIALDGSVVTTTTRTVDLETVNANTIEALHGGGAVHTASVSVDGSRGLLRQGPGANGNGISVLKETSVSYDQ